MEFNESEWHLVHAMALKLSQSQTDPNEFGKIVSYLNAYQDGDKTLTILFNYLGVLVKNGDRVGHSTRTIKHYTNIQEVCQKYLKSYRDSSAKLLQILGWTRRLLRYYNTTFIAEDSSRETESFLADEPISQRQLDIANLLAEQKFEVGQIIDAKITKVDGNKVTYSILDTISKTQKEPKHSSLLQSKIEQTVKVEISELKDDGSIKKVKYLD